VAAGDPARRKRIENMRRSNVALRLQASILDEALRVSETEGVALNQFINVAVAEKLSALRTEEYFRERAQRGDVAKAKRLLKRAGRGNPPVPGDEVE
jgi:hypothetical protein